MFHEETVHRTQNNLLCPVERLFPGENEREAFSPGQPTTFSLSAGSLLSSSAFGQQKKERDGRNRNTSWAGVNRRPDVISSSSKLMVTLLSVARLSATN